MAVTVAVVVLSFVHPAAAAPPRTFPLLVADVGKLSSDEQLLFSALEGIANRDRPRVYLTGLRNGQDFVSDVTAEKWLRDAVPLPTRRVKPYDLLESLRSKVRGLVVWDPRLRVDTQNLATTMAGLHDWLPVSPALAARLSSRFGLRVQDDLRRRGFTSRAEAYEGALTHLP